jgi:UDP-N-acetylglucosamine 2-epimerase (non-hydrolysing)
LKSGIIEENIYFVGNTMINSLMQNRQRLSKPKIWNALNLKKKEYIVMTLHRSSNEDDEGKLKQLIDEIIRHLKDLSIIFSVHPRTVKILKRIAISYSRLILI